MKITDIPGVTLTKEPYPAGFPRYDFDFNRNGYDLVEDVDQGEILACLVQDDEHPLETVLAAYEWVAGLVFFRSHDDKIIGLSRQYVVESAVALCAQLGQRTPHGPFEFVHDYGNMGHHHFSVVSHSSEPGVSYFVNHNPQADLAGSESIWDVKRWETDGSTAVLEDLIVSEVDSISSWEGVQFSDLAHWVGNQNKTDEMLTKFQDREDKYPGEAIRYVNYMEKWANRNPDHPTLMNDPELITRLRFKTAITA